MPVAWDNDNPTDAHQLARNVRSVLRQIVAEATDRRSPSIAMAQQWHRDLYRNIELPVDYYAGEIRDSDPNFPELFGYEVAVGEHLGVISALATFEMALTDAVAVVDDHLLDREATAEGAELYVTLVAVSHGEWIDRQSEGPAVDEGMWLSFGDRAACEIRPVRGSEVDRWRSRSTRRWPSAHPAARCDLAPRPRGVL
jgi:hypothetical protein